MLSITSSQPVVWASAPAPSISAVPAAAPVAPVQSSSRQAQTGSGAFGRDAPSVAQTPRAGAAPADNARESADAPAAAQAAPLLPRPSPDESEHKDGAGRVQAEEEQDQQARQAEEKALKQQLQDVISNVWKASAAVVDVALSRKIEATETASTEPAAALEPTGAVSANPTFLHGAAAANDELAPELADLRAQLEVVGYDEQGHSSLAPLEAGSLISQRV